MPLLPHAAPAFNQAVRGICTICPVSWDEVPEANACEVQSQAWCGAGAPCPWAPPTDHLTLIFLRLCWQDSNSPQAGLLTVPSISFKNLPLIVLLPFPLISARQTPHSLDQKHDPWANMPNSLETYSPSHSSSAALQSCPMRGACIYMLLPLIAQILEMREFLLS